MNYAIILAGGSGTRAGGLLPKQFQRLVDAPVVWHSIRRFHDFDPDIQIVVPLHKNFFEFWNSRLLPLARKEGVNNIEVIEGGESRIQSVKNGLKRISEELEMNSRVSSGKVKVFIHDGARPLLDNEMIDTGSKTVRMGVGCVPVVPLSDSIRKKTDLGTVTADRSMFMCVQTPQVFMLGDIISAYSKIESEDGLTDDASVAEKSGIKIATFKGHPDNIKITNPIDFAVAETLMRLRK